MKAARQVKFNNMMYGLCPHYHLLIIVVEAEGSVEDAPGSVN